MDSLSLGISIIYCFLMAFVAIKKQVRRSTRIKKRQEDVPVTSEFPVSRRPVNARARRPRNIDSSASLNVAAGNSLNESASIDAHHVSLNQNKKCNPFDYIPMMSASVEAGFNRIFYLKDQQRLYVHHYVQTGQVDHVDAVLDGLATAILRQVTSVLRPDTSISGQNKSMEHLSFLIQDVSAKPFLQVLNGYSTTGNLMVANNELPTGNNIHHNTMAASKEAVFTLAIDAADVAGALPRIPGLGEASQEMAEYILRLAASAQRIYTASEVADEEKLLWISAIRLFFISATVALGCGPGSLLGKFIAGEGLNTTLSLALGEETRANNRIDLWLLKSVFEAAAATPQVADPFGRCLWMRLFNENADKIFTKAISNGTYCIEFQEIKV